MARIQDIKQFEELICDTVNEYLQETECYEHPVMVIYREDGEFYVIIDDPENLHILEDSETYAMAKIVRNNDDNPELLEPDYDGISRIANEWIFIEH